MLAMAVAVMVLVLLGATGVAVAEREIRDFASAEERERYQRLLEEVRCMVCQNESLASSQADLAQDLRDEIYRMVREGHTRDEAVEFLVARYGDFVLYRPPMTPKTWLLWFGPLLLLGLGVVIATVVIRGQRPDDEAGLSAAEQERARKLLAPEEGSQTAARPGTNTDADEDHDRRGDP